MFEILLLPRHELLIWALQNIWFQAFGWWCEDLLERVQIVLYLKVTIQDGASWNVGSRNIVINAVRNDITAVCSMNKVFITDANLSNRQVGDLFPVLRTLNWVVIQFCCVLKGNKLNLGEKARIFDVPGLHREITVT